MQRPFRSLSGNFRKVARHPSNQHGEGLKWAATLIQ